MRIVRDNGGRTVVLLFLLLISGMAACSSVRVDQSFHTRIESTLLAEDPARELPAVRHQEPEYLSFAELVSLIHNPHPKEALGDKLARFFQTPILNNSAYLAGQRPQVSSNARLGRFIRLATWYIEKSLRIDDAVRALRSEQEYISLIDTIRTSGDIQTGTCGYA
jgi:hypothetical protein